MPWVAGDGGDETEEEVNELQSIQFDVGNYLRSDNYFVDVPVYILRDEQIQTRLDMALAGKETKGGKAGVAVLVMMPTADCSKPNAAGPALGASITCLTLENPEINMLEGVGTKKPCEEVAMNVAQRIHHLELVGVCGCLFAAKDCVTPTRDYLPRIGYETKFSALLPLTKLPRVALPRLTQNGLAVTLTPITEGSVMFYTLDETFPGAGNAAALLYNAPFAVSAGAVVRWAAFKAGWIGSVVGRQVITEGAAGSEAAPSSLLETPEGGGLLVEG